MHIRFARSARSTVGIEWELHLVDKSTGELVPAAEKLIALTHGGDDKPIRKEYLPCAIEIVSRPRAIIAEAIADIRHHVDILMEAAESIGVALMGAGSHPFSRSATQTPFRTSRYDAVTHRNGWWGRQMAICGTHVHVGVADRSHVLPLAWSQALSYPFLLALSASSPFWEGEDSGFASQRTMMFQQLPTNGLPHRFDSWEEYENHVDDLVACGVITQVQEMRWDVRPSPNFGTVENRIPDSVPTVAELGFVAAATQCLSEDIERRLDDGHAPAQTPPWLIRENKWRVARHGLDATVIQPGESGVRTTPLREAMVRWLDALMPVADDLGCARELAFGYEMLTHGASYERQRRIAARSGLRALVDAIAHETASGVPSWTGEE
ncbi:MAG: glutamate--cysteine ligase [Propionibacteriaceae bacterium]|nr:glutamate--cysteine ligase [Propionibacteriaceae bacterium]